MIAKNAWLVVTLVAKEDDIGPALHPLMTQGVSGDIEDDRGVQPRKDITDVTVPRTLPVLKDVGAAVVHQKMVVVAVTDAVDQTLLPPPGRTLNALKSPSPRKRRCSKL